MSTEDDKSADSASVAMVDDACNSSSGSVTREDDIVGDTPVTMEIDGKAGRVSMEVQEHVACGAAVTMPGDGANGVEQVSVTIPFVFSYSDMIAFPS